LWRCSALASSLPDPVQHPLGRGRATGGGAHLRGRHTASTISIVGGGDERRTFTTTTTTTTADDADSYRSLLEQHVRSRQADKAARLQEQINTRMIDEKKETEETTISQLPSQQHNKNTTLTNQRDNKKEIVSLLDAWVEQWKGRKSAMKTTVSANTTEACTTNEPISPAEMVNIIGAKSASDSDDVTWMMSLQSYGKLIDGIVEAAKAKHKTAAGLASLTETTCLDPMIRLYRQQQQQQKQPRQSSANEENNNAPTMTTTTTTLLVHSFNKIMTLYCQEKKVRAAEQLLNRLEETLDETLLSSRRGHDDPSNNNSCNIPVGTYGILIAGFAKWGMPREAEHILFARMIQKRKLLPNRDLFEVCLSAWEMARTVDAGQRAEFLILRHQQWHEAHPQQIAPPNAKTLSRAVNAWVNSRHPEAAIRIEKIIETMYAVEFHDVTILASAHLQAMKLWAWLGEPQKCNASMAFTTAQIGKARIPPLALQRMYAARITAYARSKNTLQKQLRRVMAELEEESRSGSFGPLQYWDRSIYLALFDALARNGQGADAEYLLARMIRDANDDDDQEAMTAAPQPNLKSYNSVLLAWSRSDDPAAVHRAERVFQQMRSERHQQQQRQQQQRQQDENDQHKNERAAILIRPDIVSYNAVLAALARAPVKSQALACRGESYLDEMFETESFPPTTVTFNQALLLWWRVPDVVADVVIGRTDQLLERMSLAGIPPDTNTLQACLSVVNAMDQVTDVERKRLIVKYNERFAVVRRNKPERSHNNKGKVK
jgi:pentatricopeptide repeat protein